MAPKQPKSRNSLKGSSITQFDHRHINNKFLDSPQQLSYWK